MNTKCKQRVYHPRGIWSGSQCSRNAAMDGFCRQHHPSSTEARRSKQRAEYAAHTERQIARAQFESLRVLFATECARWLADDQAIPLSPSALYTGEGPDDQTFGEVARAVLARLAVRK